MSQLEELNNRINAIEIDAEALVGAQEGMLKMHEGIPFLDGVPMKDRIGITDQEFLQLHATACAFFEKGKLNESEVFFRQLCYLDAANLDYSLGLGAVLQRKKLYDQATDVYAIAHMLQKNDSRPMFYAGQCLFFDRKHDKAKLCFEVVVRDNHSPELTRMAQIFIEAIERGEEKVEGVSDE